LQVASQAACKAQCIERIASRLTVWLLNGLLVRDFCGKGKNYVLYILQLMLFLFLAQEVQVE